MRSTRKTACRVANNCSHALAKRLTKLKKKLS